jgi:3-oxoacyl-[acyl-carrier protein] reductase
VAEQAAKRWGTDVFPVHGDVMDWDEIQRIMADCHDRMGRIDILVNSAADAVMGDFATLSREEIDRTVRGSMLGTMYCTRAALDYMIPQGGGKIINVGSESSLTAIRGQVVYGTSKAGLNAFNAFLGKEVAVHGVQVLGVNPGCMWGPDRPLQTPSPFGLYAIGRSAIQRYELPEEVANMVAFLASDASSCMAGETINMGGGMAL